MLVDGLANPSEDCWIENVYLSNNWNCKKPEDKS